MTATTAEPCWFLADEYGAEYDNGEYVPHYPTEDEAAAHAKEGFTPRQYDTPCLIPTCSTCEAVLDEDGEGREVHLAPGDELGVVTAYDWTLSDDGVVKCARCSTGCDCQDDAAGEDQ